MPWKTFLKAHFGVIAATDLLRDHIDKDPQFIEVQETISRQSART